MKTESNILSAETFFEHFGIVVEVIKNQQEQINSMQGLQERVQALQSAVDALTRENAALRDGQAATAEKIDDLKIDLIHLTHIR